MQLNHCKMLINWLEESLKVKFKELLDNKTGPKIYDKLKERFNNG